MSNGVVRKKVHVGLYLIFAMLFCSWQVLSERKMWIALVLSVAFSVIDGEIKPLVVGRHYDIEDILLNDVGAALGYVVARFIKLDKILL